MASRWLVFFYLLLAPCLAQLWGQPGHDASFTRHAKFSPSVYGGNDVIYVNSSLLSYIVGVSYEAILDTRNVAYLYLDHYTLLAWTAKTGNPIWDLQLEPSLFGQFDSLPVLNQDGRLFLTSLMCPPGEPCKSFLFAIETDIGAICWNTSDFLIYGNLVYFSEMNLILITHTAQGCADTVYCPHYLTALNDIGKTYEIIWTFDLSTITPLVLLTIAPTVGPFGDVFFGSMLNGTTNVLVSLSGENGNVNWVARPPWPADIYLSAGVTEDNLLIIYGGMGTSFVINGSDGNVLRSISGQVVAISYTDVIVVGSGTISRTYPLADKPEWTTTIQNCIFGGAAISRNETVYLTVTCYEHSNIYAFNAGTGEVEWTMQWDYGGQSPRVHTPVVTSDQHLLVVANNTLYQIGCCRSNGICTPLGCTCTEDYYAKDCSVVCHSNLTCGGHGSCDANGQCVCDTGYFTSNCSLACSCSGNGACDASGSCTCDSVSIFQIYSGFDCSSTTFTDTFYITVGAGGSAVVAVAVFLYLHKKRRRGYEVL